MKKDVILYLVFFKLKLTLNINQLSTANFKMTIHQKYIDQRNHQSAKKYKFWKAVSVCKETDAMKFKQVTNKEKSENFLLFENIDFKFVSL